MRTPPITSKITRFIENIKYEKEQRFLNKFCNISNSIEGDTFTLLNSARKTIANYAKSKGVTVGISPSDKVDCVVSHFTLSADGKAFTKVADTPDVTKLPKNKLRITVKPLKELPQRKGGRLISTSEYVSKDTSETSIHKVQKNILIDIPSDGLQRPAMGNFEYEDNFLRHIYRVIENNVKAIEHYYNK